MCAAIDTAIRQCGLVSGWPNLSQDAQTEASAMVVCSVCRSKRGAACGRLRWNSFGLSEQSEVGFSRPSKVEDYNLESQVFHPFDTRWRSTLPTSLSSVLKLGE